MQRPYAGPALGGSRPRAAGLTVRVAAGYPHLMFRGFILRYLGLVGAGLPSDEAATRLPVPLRALVLRLCRSAVIVSGFETEHSGDESHVHRLAYLRSVGKGAVDPNRIDDVRARFDANRDLRGEDRAGTRLGLSSLAWMLVASGIGAAVFVLTRPAPPTPRAVPTEGAAVIPPSEEAPPHPLTELFEERVPAYVVALDARSARREPMPPGDVAGTRARLLEALGSQAPDLVPTMSDLLDASESFSSEGAAYADEAWLQRLVLFHDALAAAEAPFYVDAQLTEYAYPERRRVLISTYSVLSRERFSYPRDADVVEVQALLLRRLDSLSFRQSLLGYTRPEIRYALVLVDRIEGFLISQHLPSMHSADESVFVRGYEDERDTHWVTEFEVWAHEDLLAEAESAVRSRGVAPEALAELARAVVQRRHAIDAMSHSLRRRGIELLQPATYAFDAERLAAFRDAENGGRLAEVREAEAALARPELRAAYEAVLDAFVVSVEEHEVQHRIDYEADRLVAVPPALAEYTGETESEDRVNRRAERANAELSAYLSQVARGPEHARTSLLHVASFLMARESWSMPEAYAALVVFSSIAESAGIEHGPLVVARRVVRGEIAGIYGAVRGRPDLADLAGRAWARLYGSELPTLTALP